MFAKLYQWKHSQLHCWLGIHSWESTTKLADVQQSSERRVLAGLVADYKAIYEIERRCIRCRKTKGRQHRVKWQFGVRESKLPGEWQHFLNDHRQYPKVENG